ncbi:acyl carrier protein [Mycoplasmopsis mustelae]|uniref:Acyl carrier protein n=1 Tax=Mycoplasmopsis mustelae TaxID=171289 RepID=A0A4R7UDG5_9BACT|nr:phosphopantetheine-binding protein [Mycoplasmopsis mustelae]TDV24479.1 acyl carrier protein [Mycoplasmopsis mustelae]
MNNEISQKVLNKLKKLSKKKVNESDELNLLNIDSLDFAELLIELEEEYKISISDEELLNLKTVKDVVDIIQIKMKQLHQN